ncbi:MAG TPA: tyrosine-protein phosphatase [Trebonia sp.]|nr:tyrosine-protein phosphatase [Trebonia sp.]
MAWIELDGAVNARDLGGLPAGDGLRIAPRTLLRSDNLQDLTPADITKLVDGLGLTTVIDLRSTGELESEGSSPLGRQVPGVNHVHLSVLPEVGKRTDVAAEALLLRRERDRSRYPDDAMCGHYLGYLEDRPESVTGALRAIAGAPGAALVHCAAGKDRTGVVIALTLTAVGVPAEAVIADYAATDQRTEAILERLKRSPTYAADLRDSPVDRHRPRPETMKAVLEQVQAHYGGARRWLADHGFTGADLERLRAKLVVAGDADRSDAG